ncbi:MAG TPA: hypothetical protein VKE73_09410 [Myxococcota bacterium]|nr:hypothetical protein [Myxococcota bacterium]
MRSLGGLLLATMLVVGAACARSDWIDRTLVTVDVTGNWHGKVTGLGGAFLIGDLFLELAQQGSTVKGTLQVRGTGAALVVEPIDGSIAGDVFRFRNPRGTLTGELTVSGDEMSGVALTSAAGRRNVSLHRVDTSSTTSSTPR